MDMTEETIRKLAETLIQDDESREAALRAVERAWDPRTGLDGLVSLLRSFGPTAVPLGWDYV